MSTRRLVALASMLLIAAMVAPATLATSVTPFKNAKWQRDQQVNFMWKADAKPPAWMKPAVLDAASDAGSTTKARAANFSLADSASSWIAYTDSVARTPPSAAPSAAHPPRSRCACGHRAGHSTGATCAGASSMTHRGRTGASTSR